MNRQNGKGLRSAVSATLRNLIEQPLYTAGIAAYREGVRAASLNNPKARKLMRGQKEIWSRLAAADVATGRWIWVHASSLGEFEQGRPLMEEIRRTHPEYKILLTFFSPSGYEVRKDYAGADCVCYLPFDTPGNVRRFLEMVKPEMAFFIKYEFWRNYLDELNRRNIPVYLVSAVFRADQPFFRKGTSWYGKWLNWYSRIFVQDAGSLRLLEGIGIRNVEVAGDTRFDRVTDILNSRKEIPELELIVGKGKTDLSPMVVAFGSSWPADEAVYGEWLRTRKEVRAIIAPHEFDGPRLHKLKEIALSETVLLSEIKANPRMAEGKRIVIVDCFGLLSSAYAYADVAYIGGGFGVGIHNINEAAVYGIPVMFGPENSKFIEAQDLKTLGGGIEVDGKAGFSKWADRMLYDKEERKKRGRWAGEYISEQTGASGRILRKIFG